MNELFMQMSVVSDINETNDDFDAMSNPCWEYRYI